MRPKSGGLGLKALKRAVWCRGEGSQNPFKRSSSLGALDATG